MSTSANRPTTLRPGDALRHYRIERQIGAGGMGIVYEARHDKLDTRIAIKEFAIQSDDENIDPELAKAGLDGFVAEAKVLINLDHSQIPQDGADIPKVYDLFEENGSWYLVMEYISGKTLDDILYERDYPIDVDDAVRWGTAILRTLTFLHELEPPIIHRDIKPSNLKLNEQGRVVLLDFGVAKSGTTNRDQRTSSTSQFASFYYSPPEQFRGRGTDARSDLFALGGTLYFLLTGQRPPDAQERVNLTLLDRQPDPLRLASDVNPAIPRYIAAALQTALAIKPDQRFESAELFRAHLADPWGQAADYTGSMQTATPSRPVRTGAVSRPISAPITGKAIVDEEPTTGDVVFRPGGMGYVPPPPTRNVPWGGIVIGVVALFILLGAVGVWQGWFPFLRATTAGVAQANDGEIAVPTPATADATPAPTFTPNGLPTAFSSGNGTTGNNVAVGATSTRLPSPTSDATATPTETETPTPTTEPSATPDDATATATAITTPSATIAPVVNGSSAVLTFENCGSWRRGNESWGTFQCSGAQTNSGSRAGEIAYDFTNAGDNDYLVFQQRNAISGEPRSLNMMVYGDGSGHFLNVWIRDNDGEVWQMPLGTVSHTGWRRMNGAVDTTQAWPWTRISGSGNGAVSYPITFEAVVLDGHPERSQRRGTIYMDDLTASSDIAYPVFGGGSGGVAVNPTATSAAPVATSPAPAATTAPMATATQPTLGGTPTQPVLPITPTSPPAPTATTAPRPPISVRDQPAWQQISVNQLITLTWDNGFPIGSSDSAYIRVFQDGVFARNITIPTMEWNNQNFYPFRGHQVSGGTDRYGRFTVFIELVDVGGNSLARSQQWEYEVGP